MPLISTHMPAFEHASRSVSGFRSFRNGDDDYQYPYESSARAEGENETLKTLSVVQYPQMRKVRSVLNMPPRNTLRTSRSLGILAMEVRASEEQAEPETKHQRHLAAADDPLEHYLSSEEDASESTDDYESSIDFHDDAQSDSILSRSSYEDTARAVFVVYVGKPTLVEILSQIQVATAIESPPRRRPVALRIDSLPLSIAASPSPSTFSSSLKRSPNASIRSYVDTSSASDTGSSRNPAQKSFRRRPSFLTLDPFALSSSTDPDASSPREQTTPKTPTALAKAAWKGGVSRTISLAKRRPSIPRLSMSYSQAPRSSLSTPRSSVSSPIPTPLPYIDSSVLRLDHGDDAYSFSSSKLNLNFMIDRKPVSQNQTYTNDRPQSRYERTEAVSTNLEQSRFADHNNASPVTYNEIMRHAIRVSPSEQSPVAPRPASPRGHQANKSRSSMLSLGLGFGSKTIRA